MEGPAASRFIPPCVGNSPAANPLQIAAVPSSRRYGRPRKKVAVVYAASLPSAALPAWAASTAASRPVPPRDSNSDMVTAPRL